MRDLTLIVTDGHTPAGLKAEALAAIDRVPSAELLRARGETQAGIADWWQALFMLPGAGRPQAAQDLALASVAWFGLTGTRDAQLWFATPVRLMATINHVRLDAVGAPPSLHGDSLAADFNRDFAGQGLTLHADLASQWFLEIARDLSAATIDPCRLVGGDVTESLPSGRDGPYLRRLMTEAQMWLHSRASGPQSINGLWVWGGGRSWPDLAGRTLPMAASDEPLLRGLWRLGDAPCVDPVANFAQARELHAESVVATIALERWRNCGESQPLLRLERDWLAPAWTAISAGSIAGLGLYLNGAFTRASRRHCWRLWRARRHWAET